MNTLKDGWQLPVAAYLREQREPVIVANVAHEALGIDSDQLSIDEYNALSRALHRAGYRKRTVWIPPSPEQRAAA
jgi:hypothetical protein